MSNLVAVDVALLHEPYRRAQAKVAWVDFGFDDAHVRLPVRRVSWRGGLDADGHVELPELVVTFGTEVPLLVVPVRSSGEPGAIHDGSVHPKEVFAVEPTTMTDAPFVLGAVAAPSGFYVGTPGCFLRLGGVETLDFYAITVAPILCVPCDRWPWNCPVHEHPGDSLGSLGSYAYEVSVRWCAARVSFSEAVD